MKQIISLLLFSVALFCDEPQSPWFTGPLLAPTARTVEAGKTNYQPYLYATNNYRPEDSWVYSPFILVDRGVNSFMDVKFKTQLFITTTGDQVGTNLSDFTVIIGFQAMRDNLDSLMPDFRISFGEVFPTGSYERLNPNKLGTDATGGGSFQTFAGLHFQKLFHIRGEQWLRPRLFLRYTVPAPVSVHEHNAYGGGFATDGKVYPGNYFTGIVAIEYSLTQNWVLAMDVQALYIDKTTFSGFPGFELDNNRKEELATVGTGKSVQWSYAPAIEYNFNDWLGVIGGVWFTGATSNSVDFVSYVFSVNMVL